MDHQQAIQNYQDATVQEQQLIPFLWAILPSRVQSDINEAPFHEVVWTMKQRDVREYEVSMYTMQYKVAQWSAQTAKYKYTKFKDLLVPYGQEMLAYFEHVYLVEKDLFQEADLENQRQHEVANGDAFLESFRVIIDTKFKDPFTDESMD